MIHLDIKPANVMFKTQDFEEIVLLDFGISKFIKDDDNYYDKVFGMTICYSPPEIVFQT